MPKYHYGDTVLYRDGEKWIKGRVRSVFPDWNPEVDPPITEEKISYQVAPWTPGYLHEYPGYEKWFWSNELNPFVENQVEIE